MKLKCKAVKIYWKIECLHRPVFRRTVKSLDRYMKSHEPLTRHILDHHSDCLGEAAGFSDKLNQYAYRRGAAQMIDSRSSIA